MPVWSVCKVQQMFGLVARWKRRSVQVMENLLSREFDTRLALQERVGFQSVAFLLDFLL